MPNVTDTIVQIGQLSLVAIAGWLALILFLSLVDHPPRRTPSTDDPVVGKPDEEEEEEEEQL
jgi:hypothetical protein